MAYHIAALSHPIAEAEAAAKTTKKVDENLV